MEGSINKIKTESKVKVFIGKLKKRRNFSLCVWLIGFAIVWEIIAFYVQFSFRTPENYLPHIYDVIISIFASSNSILFILTDEISKIFLFFNKFKLL
jgi:hypothetical protein